MIHGCPPCRRDRHRTLPSSSASPRIAGSGNAGTAAAQSPRNSSRVSSHARKPASNGAQRPALSSIRNRLSFVSCRRSDGSSPVKAILMEPQLLQILEVSQLGRHRTTQSVVGEVQHLELGQTAQLGRNRTGQEVVREAQVPECGQVPRARAGSSGRSDRCPRQTRRLPAFGREPPARGRSPAAAPAGSREAGPTAQLVEDLIGAVVRRRLSPLAGALGVRADGRDGRREASRAEGDRPGAAGGGGRPPTGLDVGGSATQTAMASTAQA